MEVAAAGRKAEDAPARVLPVALDAGDGFRRTERGVEHGGIAEVQIDFAEGHVIALRDQLTSSPNPPASPKRCAASSSDCCAELRLGF